MGENEVDYKNDEFKNCNKNLMIWKKKENGGNLLQVNNQKF